MNARTLTVFRLYQLFNGIEFTGPIWAVFLLSRGLSLTQFGLVEAALHVGMLVAQVPTGAFADALGRRKLLVASGFFVVVAQLGYVYAPGFWLICAAGAVHGVAFALRTGADEAYLFDALAHDDAQEMFPRMLGGVWAVFQFAGALSFLAGGLIATVSRPLAFWLTAVCALTASVIATRLPDDAATRGEASSTQVALDGVRALGRSPRLAMLTVAWALYWSAVTTAWYYSAPFLQDRGASDATLGFVLGGALFASAGFSWVGGHLPGRTPLTISVGLASAVAAAGMVLGPLSVGLVAPIVLLVLFSGLPELVYVSLSTYLQHNTRSAFRATSMSIAEGCFSIVMLGLFPLVGVLNQHVGWTLGYAVCALLLIGAAGMFIASQRLAGLEEPAVEPEAAAA